MDKHELLLEVHRLANAGQLTQAEVLSAMTGQTLPAEDILKRRLSISEIMYYIGGGIIFLGIVILVDQNWDSFNTVLRIATTLGSCAAAFIVAILFNRYE